MFKGNTTEQPTITFCVRKRDICASGKGGSVPQQPKHRNYPGRVGAPLEHNQSSGHSESSFGTFQSKCTLFVPQESPSINQAPEQQTRLLIPF